MTLTHSVIISASQLVVNQNGELIPMMSESPKSAWLTGQPPVHVITAGSALIIIREQKMYLLRHITSVNASCLWNKQTNKQTMIVGHDLFKHPRWGKQTQLRFVAFFTNDWLLFPLRVRWRLQCTHLPPPPFLCTTVTGSAHCLDHMEDTELNPFLDVSLLFLYKPPPPQTSPPPLRPPQTHTLVAETRFHILLPPLDHHC